MRTRGILAAGIAAAAVAASAGGGLTASAETLSGLSGTAGDVVAEARVDAGGALRSLMVLERSDRPCVVQVYGNLVPVDSYEGRVERCRGGGPTRADGTDSTKGKVFIGGGGSYATGLRVCLSDSDRVKGWTIYGVSNASPHTVSESFRRPNCPDDGWRSRIDCPAGTRAIGVRAHFAAATGNNSDMLSGMQLICE